MTRELFMAKLEKIIETSPIEAISKNALKQKYKGDNGKNGIYFLYNEKEEIIYIGKVGNGLVTSFYHRLYGHGNGAHKNTQWFQKECSKYRFKRFPNATDDDLRVIERLMIFKKGQPQYNDIGKIIYKFEDIVTRIK